MINDTAVTMISQGTSSTAEFVAERLQEGRRRLSESFALGLRAKGVFDELVSVFEECQKSGWDGYGAEPISEEVYGQAYELLEALPLGIPVPSVGAEPDGHLTLEWYRSPRRVLSVSISPEGMIYYAALLGERKRSGAAPFVGDVPDEVLRIIGRLFAS